MLTEEEKRAIEDKIAVEYKAKEHELEMREYAKELRKKRNAEVIKNDAIPAARIFGRILFVIIATCIIFQFIGDRPHSVDSAMGWICILSFWIFFTPLVYCSKVDKADNAKWNRKSAGFMVLRHSLYACVVWFISFGWLHRVASEDYIKDTRDCFYGILLSCL